MKIVKYAGFGMAILLSLGMINQATSYTSAQVTSNASVRIVSESEDALIGIKVEENEVEANDKEEILIPFTIKNHINRAITKISIVESDNDTIIIENNQDISAGNSSDGLKFKYTGSKPSFVEIKCNWDGGSATIRHSFDLDSSQISELLEKEVKKDKLDEKKALEEESIVKDMIQITEDKDEENKEQKTDKVEQEIAEDQADKKVQEEQKEEGKQQINSTEERSTEKEKPEQ